MICTYYVGDPDGPVSAWGRVANNFYAIYNRAKPDGFKFFRHDAEHSLDNVQESRLFASTTMAVGASFNQSNPMWMHTHLVLHPEYKMRFADRVYKYFFNGGLLTPEVCTDRFMARAEQIETAIIAESARWGDAKRTKPRTKDDDWTPDMQRMVDDYFPRRTGIVLNQLKIAGAGTRTSTRRRSVKHGGYLDAGDAVSLQGGAGTVWYTLDGSDPRIPGSTPATGDELQAGLGERRQASPGAHGTGRRCLERRRGLRRLRLDQRRRRRRLRTQHRLSRRSSRSMSRPRCTPRNATCYLRIPFRSLRRISPL